MRRNSTLAVALAGVLWLLAGLIVAGEQRGAALAAAPPAVHGAAGQVAQISDRLHHISGVIAVPLSRMVSGQAGSAGKPGWAGPLTPPVFGPNVDASLINSSDQNETTIAINPEDSQRVIASANDYRANLKPYVYLSTNGGTSWTNYPVPGVANLYYGDPAMTFGTGSNAYFGYLGYTALCGGAGGMYASHSTDGGSTFSAPIQLAANSNNGTVAVLQDKEYVAVDNNPTSPYSGTVYEGWTRFSFQAGGSCGDPSTQIEAPVVLSRSTDHGNTWSQPIAASPVYSNNNQGTVPVVGRHGEVYLYYVGAQTQQQLNYDSVLFSRSTDGGQTFPFFTHISNLVDLPSPLPHTSFRNNPFGAMAADRQLDGYLYAVWADYRTGDADILLSRSTDNGNTWSAPRRVNDDPAGNGKDQFFPWISTSPDGVVHIGWFDRREDPNDANYKEYYTYSDDHGDTFAPNVAVSTAPSVPGSSGFIGDYSGIASTNGVVMPVWTDIRTGSNQNAYTGRGVYTTGASPTPTATGVPTNTATPTGTETATASATAPSTVTATPTASPTVCSISFSDVTPSDYFYQDVRCVYCLGAVSGYADGTFRPFNNTTRGQMTKIIVIALQIPIVTPTGTPTFNDVPSGSPFYAYVETAAANQIVSGYNCGGPGEPCPGLYFRPNNNVTRGQLTKIVVVAGMRVFGWELRCPTTPTFADVPVGDPFYCYVETAICHNVISGYADRTFREGNNAIRAQIAKIVCRTSQNPPDSCAPTPTPTATP